MEALLNLIGGFSLALQPQYLVFAALGVTLGSFIGVLPGIGPSVTVALLLPLTFGLEPVGAFIMFAGIYYGALYGGAITSILLNTPGEAGSVATAIDGHPMARAGRGGKALATAILGSFFAGTISTIALTFLAPLVAQLALLFRPADYFALMVFAFVSVTALVGSSITRGMLSLFIGLTIGLVGLDTLTGQARFTFGVPQLFQGIDVVIVAVGLFAVGEALYAASQLRRGEEGELTTLRGRLWLDRADFKRVWKPWIRGGSIGFLFGAMPTGGSEVPTFLSYNIEKQLSRHKEEFGKGAIEGVAGPEAANNASFSGVMIPLLTLGIPTSATAAVMLAAFQIYNLQPGPLLFQNAPDLVWALIASLYIGNLMLLVINLPLIRIWVKILEVPKEIIYAAILTLATLGAYSISNSVIDVLVLYAIGVLGFFMRRYDFPVAPAILGAILGPMMEAQFRRALSISQGDASIFFTRPISLTLLLLAVVVVFLPHLPKLAARLRS
jgi:putative tricarboxylic transport membrane protein